MSEYHTVVQLGEWSEEELIIFHIFFSFSPENILKYSSSTKELLKNLFFMKIHSVCFVSDATL